MSFLPDGPGAANRRRAAVRIGAPPRTSAVRSRSRVAPGARVSPCSRSAAPAGVPGVRSSVVSTAASSSAVIGSSRSPWWKRARPVSRAPLRVVTSTTAGRPAGYPWSRPGSWRTVTRSASRAARACRSSAGASGVPGSGAEQPAGHHPRDAELAGQPADRTTLRQQGRARVGVHGHRRHLGCRQVPGHRAGHRPPGQGVRADPHRLEVGVRQQRSGLQRGIRPRPVRRGLVGGPAEVGQRRIGGREPGGGESGDGHAVGGAEGGQQVVGGTAPAGVGLRPGQRHGQRQVHRVGHPGGVLTGDDPGGGGCGAGAPPTVRVHPGAGRAQQQTDGHPPPSRPPAPAGTPAGSGRRPRWWPARRRTRAAPGGPGTRAGPRRTG